MITYFLLLMVRVDTDFLQHIVYIKKILSKLDTFIDEKFPSNIPKYLSGKHQGDLAKHRLYTTRYEDLCK